MADEHTSHKHHPTQKAKGLGSFPPGLSRTCSQGRSKRAPAWQSVEMRPCRQQKHLRCSSSLRGPWWWRPRGPPFSEPNRGSWRVPPQRASWTRRAPRPKGPSSAPSRQRPPKRPATPQTPPPSARVHAEVRRAPPARRRYHVGKWRSHHHRHSEEVPWMLRVAISSE